MASSTLSVAAAAAAAAAAEPSMDGMEVVTYNVLTPRYCDAKSYPQCDPAHLSPAKRFDRVWAQLQPHVAAGSVLCLQEVCVDWADKLQARAGPCGAFRRGRAPTA